MLGSALYSAPGFVSGFESVHSTSPPHSSIRSLGCIPTLHPHPHTSHSNTPTPPYPHTPTHNPNLHFSLDVSSSAGSSYDVTCEDTECSHHGACVESGPPGSGPYESGPYGSGPYGFLCECDEGFMGEICEEGKITW